MQPHDCGDRTGAFAVILSRRLHISLQAPVEKASIDEVYIDVTGMVEAELQSLGGGAGTAEAGGDASVTSGFGKYLSWHGCVMMPYCLRHNTVPPRAVQHLAGGACLSWRPAVVQGGAASSSTARCARPRSSSGGCRWAP